MSLKKYSTTAGLVSKSVSRTSPKAPAAIVLRRVYFYPLNGPRVANAHPSVAAAPLTRHSPTEISCLSTSVVNLHGYNRGRPNTTTGSCITCVHLQGTNCTETDVICVTLLSFGMKSCRRAAFVISGFVGVSRG